MTAISKTDDSRITKGNVCLLFSATWCGPCRMLKSALEKAAEENKDKVSMFVVDVDGSQELASKYGVRSVPTAVVLSEGEVLDILHGVGNINIGNIMKRLL